MSWIQRMFELISDSVDPRSHVQYVSPAWAIHAEEQQRREREVVELDDDSLRYAAAVSERVRTGIRCPKPLAQVVPRLKVAGRAH